MASAWSASSTPALQSSGASPAPRHPTPAWSPRCPRSGLLFLHTVNAMPPAVLVPDSAVCTPTQKYAPVLHCSLHAEPLLARASNGLFVACAQVYVGAAIEPLVDFLCSELAAAFRAEGATLPPWRAADAMLSKWRPRRRSVDCDMLPPHGSFPRA